MCPDLRPAGGRPATAQPSAREGARTGRRGGGRVAARYTSPESDVPSRGSALRRLLGLPRRHRPLHPRRIEGARARHGGRPRRTGIRLLEDALGADAAAVRFTDMAELGRNPARIIPAWQRVRPRARLGPGAWHRRADLGRAARRRARGVPGPRVPDQHGVRGHRRVQPHVSRTTSPGSSPPSSTRRAAATRSSPTERTAVSRASATAAPSRRRRRRCRRREGAPTCSASSSTRCPTCASSSAERATAAGLDANKTGQLVLAANELASNSVRHGGGFGVLRVWVDGDAVVCEVRDQGHIGDPLAGRHTPRARPGRRVGAVDRQSDLRSGRGPVRISRHRGPRPHLRRGLTLPKQLTRRVL